MGRINARLAGEPEALEGVLAGSTEGTLESFGEDPSAPTSLPGGRPRRLEEVARKLGADGPFTEAAFREGLEAAGLPTDEVAGLLRRLVDANVLYEPRAGTYAVLG